VIVAVFGYRTLFVVGGLSAIANLVASARMAEPRQAADVDAGEMIPA
jgi:hypothetical protein